MSDQIATQVEIEVDGKSYTLKRPNTGQLISIESIKDRLTLGRYDNMARSKTFASQNALNMVDMMAHMSVLSPQILKDLNVDIEVMDIMDSIPVLKVYMEKVEPWVANYQKALYEVAKFISQAAKEKNKEVE